MLGCRWPQIQWIEPPTSLLQSLLQRVKRHKQFLDEILKEDEDGDSHQLECKSISTEKIEKAVEEESQPSPKDDDEGKAIHVSNHDEEEEEDDDDDELLNDNYVQCNKAQIRESIHKLLNVHKPLFDHENEDEEELSAKPVSRLNQRLTRLTKIYHDEDDDNENTGDRKEKVLAEKNLNVDAKNKTTESEATDLSGLKRGGSNLKDRLTAIARFYYPVNQEEEPEPTKKEPAPPKPSWKRTEPPKTPLSTQITKPTITTPQPKPVEKPKVVEPEKVVK